MGSVIEIIKKRSSTRGYTSETLTDEELQTLIHAGLQAPTAANKQEIHFTVLKGDNPILLDQKGICASSGSACTSGALDPSHVLLAIGLPHEIAHGSLRLTLSEETAKEELDYVVETLKKIIERLRNMSPLYEDYLKSCRMA